MSFKKNISNTQDIIKKDIPHPTPAECADNSPSPALGSH